MPTPFSSLRFLVSKHYHPGTAWPLHAVAYAGRQLPAGAIAPFPPMALEDRPAVLPVVHVVE